MNQTRKGTVCIRQGNENIEPSAVYVGGVNKMGLLVLHKLNSGQLLFSEPEKDDLLDFDHNTLKRLQYEWMYENAEKTKGRALELLNSL